MTGNEPVRCSCGDTLLDEVGENDVAVAGERFRFARTTDYVICVTCGSLYRVADLRSGENLAAGAAIHELAMLSRPAT